jgi:hypothetical protein
MKKAKLPKLSRLALNRETLRRLDDHRLQQVPGGATRPGASCYPVICFTTTVASSCC